MTFRMFVSCFSLLFLLWISPYGEAEEFRLGVLVKRSAPHVVDLWQEQVDYLDRTLPHHRFELVLLSFDQVAGKVLNKEIDFLISNPAMFVEYSRLTPMRPIATMVRHYQGQEYALFGGVVFTRRDSPGVTRLTDLSGKRFVAVSPDSWGGFLAVWVEMEKYGLDPYRHFSSLIFAKSHDEAVQLVMSGMVDAGAVRTDTLEFLAQEGHIDMNGIRVLNEKSIEGYPFKVSTHLYSEWPFIALPHVPEAVIEELAAALVKMDGVGTGFGWMAAQNYDSVAREYKSLSLTSTEPLERSAPLLSWATVKALWVTWLVLFLALAGSYVQWRWECKQKRT